MQPGVCKAKKPWDVPEQTMLSASSGLQLSWTLCPVTRAARAQKLNEAPLILLCFAVTSYYFYMLWRKGLEKSQSMTSESVSWVLADSGAKHCCILLVGSLLMICLTGRSQSWVLLWKHCTGVFGGSFLHLEQRMGEVRISGCHFRVEMTFLGDTSGCKAQETLASAVYGCSSLLPPQVLN